MTDNKRKRGKSDRIRTAGGELYELYYVARKFGVKTSVVRDVIKQVGNKRTDVYAELKKENELNGR